MADVNKELVELAKESLKDLKKNFEVFSKQVAKVLTEMETEGFWEKEGSADLQFIASMAVMAAVLQQFTQGLGD